MQIQQDDPERDWTAAGVYEVAAGTWRIPLPLPTDGLKAVNVYALQAADGLVMVDAGWARPEAREALEKALAALGYGLPDVQRFLVTHHHRDHYTLGVVLRREFGMHIALGAQERESLALGHHPDWDSWAAMVDELHRAGADELNALLAGRHSPHNPDEYEPPDQWLTDRTEIAVGDRRLTAVETPGHTRGHFVFVDADRDVTLAGDHVLPHITPSIGFEAAPGESPLREFLRSLHLMLALPDRRLLPAHGPQAPSVHARAQELLDHHAVRLDAIEKAVTGGASTAYEAAKRLHWTRRLRRFAELDPFNRMMATTETAAHLEVLAERGILRRTVEDGVRLYAPA